MNVMILAAGEGTRLRPYTLENPKPVIPFLSVPLACYSLSLLDRIEIDRLVVNTYHLPQKIEKFFKSHPKEWKELQFSSEQDQLLGSGGGIHKAKQHLMGHGDFFVLNGDEIILPHEMGLLEEMVKFHKRHKGIATLLTMEHPEVGSKFGGAWVSGDSQVKCFSKTKPEDASLRGLHFMGVMILSEKVFRYFKDDVVVENILYETLTAAMADQQDVHVFECKAEWFETGNPTDFMKATEDCLDQLKQASGDRPYWIEHLRQTICMYSQNNYIIEKDWARFEELQTTIKRIKKGL